MCLYANITRNKLEDGIGAYKKRKKTKDYSNSLLVTLYIRVYLPVTRILLILLNVCQHLEEKKRLYHRTRCTILIIFTVLVSNY